MSSPCTQKTCFYSWSVKVIKEREKNENKSWPSSVGSKRAGTLRDETTRTHRWIRRSNSLQQSELHSETKCPPCEKRNKPLQNSKSWAKAICLKIKYLPLGRKKQNKENTYVRHKSPQFWAAWRWCHVSDSYSWLTRSYCRRQCSSKSMVNYIQKEHGIFL